MTESNLDSLVYVSSAVRLLSPEEIEYLLRRARERNLEYGISGVLLYIGGNFMQYLEGPRASLDIIYRIIREDEQHSGIILVSREAVDSRQFGEWSMAFQTRDVKGFVGPPEEKRIIEARLALDDENPSTARIVLNGFWNRKGS